MRRRLRYVVLVALVAALTGCARDDPPAADAAASPLPSMPPATASPDPLAQCVRQLTYWVEESLRGAPDMGYDYQQMGLTNAKYNALRSVLARAAEQEIPGPLPAGWVRAEVAAACREVLARPSASPTGGGWP